MTYRIPNPLGEYGILRRQQSKEHVAEKSKGTRICKAAVTELKGRARVKVGVRAGIRTPMCWPREGSVSVMLLVELNLSVHL